MKYSLAAFVVAVLALLTITGVQTGGDTGLYLDGARRILDNQPLVDRAPSYAGYIGVVAVCQALGVGLLGVVLVQIAIATLAAAAVYRLAAELAGSRAAMIGTALFTIDVDTNRWHTFVLADSLYLSVFAISVWLVYAASKTPHGVGGYVAASASLAFCSVVRPEGWFLVPAAALYWIVRGVEQRTTRMVSAVAVLAVCAIVIVVVTPRLSGNVAAVDPGEMLRRGQTMWDYDGWRLTMPDAVPDRGEGSAGRALRYASRHPLDSARLMAARVAVHLAHVRPVYSTWHNVVIVLWLLPVYVLAVRAVTAQWTRPMVAWCVVAFSSQAVVVALTHADLDGRYLSHVLPIVYPLTASGLVMMTRGNTAVVAHG